MSDPQEEIERVLIHRWTLIGVWQLVCSLEFTVTDGLKHNMCCWHMHLQELDCLPKFVDTLNKVWGAWGVYRFGVKRMGKREGEVL